MKKITMKRMFGLLAALLFGGMTHAQTAGAPLSTEAIRMGNANLSAVLQWVDPEDIELYGFSRTDDFSAVRVGKPIYQEGFTQPALQGSKMETQVYTIMMPLWLDGTVRCFLYISPDEAQQWQVVGIGGANEAKAWMPRIKAADADSKQDRLTMMHINQTGSDYFIVQNRERGAEEYVDVSIWKDNDQRSSKEIAALYKETVEISKKLAATTKADSN